LTPGNFNSIFTSTLDDNNLETESPYFDVNRLSIRKTARLKPISGGSFSNKLHLVCFLRSFLKSTSEPVSCLEFLYCFLVRLHRWQTGNENDFLRNLPLFGGVGLFARLNNRHACTNIRPFYFYYDNMKNFI